MLARCRKDKPFCESMVAWFTEPNKTLGFELLWRDGLIRLVKLWKTCNVVWNGVLKIRAVHKPQIPFKFRAGGVRNVIRSGWLTWPTNYDPEIRPVVLSQVECLMTDGLIVWLVDLSIDSLIDWLIDWFIDWFTEWVSERVGWVSQGMRGGVWMRWATQIQTCMIKG